MTNGIVLTAALGKAWAIESASLETLRQIAAREGEGAEAVAAKPKR